MDLRLYILDGVRYMYVDSDGFAIQGLHEDMHVARGRDASSYWWWCVVAVVVEVVVVMVVVSDSSSYWCS